MNLDRRKLRLWGILIVSCLFTTYQLVFNRPSRGAPLPPAAAQAPVDVPAPAQGAAPPAADPAAAAVPVAVPDAGTAGPATPLAAADLAAWQVAAGGTSRDPFFTAAEIAAMGRPPAEAPVPVAPLPPLPSYTVKLVLMEGSEGRALIDDRVVEVGDRLGEELVAEIVPDAVVLEARGTRRRLPVTGSRTAGITLERNR